MELTKAAFVSSENLCFARSLFMMTLAKCETIMSAAV